MLGFTNLAGQFLGLAGPYFSLVDRAGPGQFLGLNIHPNEQ